MQETVWKLLPKGVHVTRRALFMHNMSHMRSLTAVHLSDVEMVSDLYPKYESVYTAMPNQCAHKSDISSHWYKLEHIWL